jgi:hypothetical protein
MRPGFGIDRWEFRFSRNRRPESDCLAGESSLRAGVSRSFTWSISARSQVGGAAARDLLGAVGAGTGEVYATETLAGKAVVRDPRRPVHRMSDAPEEFRKWMTVPAIMGQNLEVRQFPESWKSDAFAKAELLANRGRKRWQAVRSVFP